MAIDSIRIQRVTQRYEKEPISRDNDLKNYDYFLSQLGETKGLKQLVEEVLARKKNCRVLDLGCGNGQALAELKLLFGKKIHTMGMDLLPATAKIDNFEQGDVVSKDLPPNCDLIISFKSMHEMGNMPRLFPKIISALDKSGKFYAIIRVKEEIGKKIKYLGEMTVDEENFLQKIAAFKSWGGARLHCQSVSGMIPGESGVPVQSTGYALVVEKLP